MSGREEERMSAEKEERMSAGRICAGKKRG
jgi:hypothetical protein